MIYEWVDRNVQVGKVAECVEAFFRDRQFETAVEEEKGKWSLSALKKVKDQTYVVGVAVYGNPDDFFVEFGYDTLGRTFGKLTTMLSLFGFGALIRRQLNKEPFLERLEEQFWDYLESCLEKERNLRAD